MWAFDFSFSMFKYFSESLKIKGLENLKRTVLITA